MRDERPIGSLSFCSLLGFCASSSRNMTLSRICLSNTNYCVAQIFSFVPPLCLFLLFPPSDRLCVSGPRGEDLVTLGRPSRTHLGEYTLLSLHPSLFYHFNLLTPFSPCPHSFSRYLHAWSAKSGLITLNPHSASCWRAQSKILSTNSLHRVCRARSFSRYDQGG